ncbi:hypothetical protein EJB05_39526 [Eragrostis curvula]|uniref:Uncharacterized protein n=1 Tax=Eragrostis curvula TaxID=38414 RepID=A0A5J9TXB0_9POAL|nr:hypothetical protein EJB05_39526 [Eragrostis curvula]
MLLSIVGTSSSSCGGMPTGASRKPSGGGAPQGKCKCASMEQPIARGSGICVGEGKMRTGTASNEASKRVPGCAAPLPSTVSGRLTRRINANAKTKLDNMFSLKQSHSTAQIKWNHGLDWLSTRPRARKAKGEGVAGKERWPCSAIEDMSRERRISLMHEPVL